MVFIFLAVHVIVLLLIVFNKVKSVSYTVTKTHDFSEPSFTWRIYNLKKIGEFESQILFQWICDLNTFFQNIEICVIRILFWGFGPVLVLANFGLLLPIAKIQKIEFSEKWKSSLSNFFPTHCQIFFISH